jgi:hypothetical protein
LRWGGPSSLQIDCDRTAGFLTVLYKGRSRSMANSLNQDATQAELMLDLRSKRRIGLLALSTFFLTLGIIELLTGTVFREGIWVNDAAFRNGTALTGGLMMTLFAIILIVWTFRRLHCRVRIFQRQIEVTTFIGTKLWELDQLEIHWEKHTFKLKQAESLKTLVQFYVNDFDKPTRKIAASFLRKLFPEDRQKNWGSFWEKNWRIFDERDKSPDSPCRVLVRKQIGPVIIYYLPVLAIYLIGFLPFIIFNVWEPWLWINYCCNGIILLLGIPFCFFIVSRRQGRFEAEYLLSRNSEAKYFIKHHSKTLIDFKYYLLFQIAPFWTLILLFFSYMAFLLWSIKNPDVIPIDNLILLGYLAVFVPGFITILGYAFWGYKKLWPNAARLEFDQKIAAEAEIYFGMGRAES